MSRKLKRETTETSPPEKHPLEKLPPNKEQAVTAEDLDRIPDEEEEEGPGNYQPPAPGEGP